MWACWRFLYEQQSLSCVAFHVSAVYVCSRLLCVFRCVWLISLHRCCCSGLSVLSLLLPLSFLFLWECLAGVLGREQARRQRCDWHAEIIDDKSGDTSECTVVLPIKATKITAAATYLYVELSDTTHTTQRLPVRPSRRITVQIEQESRNEEWKIQITWEGKLDKWI